MKKDYFDILGVPTEADKKEIKRAYFKLVRIYSPEKDSEKFQEIREAYENLMADSQELEPEIFEIPEGKIAGCMIDQVRELMKKGDFIGAIDVAEQANIFFGQTEGFLYYLALAQRLAGFTGKSVKNFERLTALFPDKVRYHRELAISYMERGFGRKAYIAFEQAYAMGCRDDEFILMFSVCGSDRGAYRPSEEIMLEMVRKERSSLRDSMEEMTDAFMGLFMLNIKSKSGLLLEEIAEFECFIGKAAAYLKEYEEEFAKAAGAMLLASTDRKGEALSKAEAVIEDLRSRIPGRDFDNNLNEALGNVKLSKITSDDRLSEAMKNGYMAHITASEFCGGDSRIERFLRLDTTLCIMEEWPGNRKEFDIVKKQYPEYYEKIRDLQENLENGKKDLLRNRFLKDYDRLNSYFDVGSYYVQYPQMKKGAKEVKWDSSEEGSYVRAEKKSGRNDPCPCGSGKKYKNCCGRNV